MNPAQRRRNEMKIAIGSDHGGYALKMELIPVIEKLGFEVADFGCPDEKSVDYPDVAFPVAEAVANGEYARGIVVCGTGIGVSIFQRGPTASS